MPYDVFGIGNALVDLQVQVDEADLASLSLEKGTMGLTSPAEQRQILAALAGRIDNVCSGGSAANTIHGIGALGGFGYYLGRVANDEYGKLYARDMSDCGVGFPGPDAVDHGTGTSVVLITPDAQRTLCTHLGISTQLHADTVDPAVVGAAKVVYIEGYLWDAEEPRAAALRVAEIANQAAVPVAFTLSDAFLIHRYRDDLLSFIDHHVDILFCNEVEGAALAGQESTDEAFRELLKSVSRLFVTLGGKGARVAQEGEEPISIRPFPARLVDTTGAGDLFAAGALYGLSNGHTLEESGILGSYCGSRIVSQLGARLPERIGGEVTRIFEQYHADAT